MLKVVEFPNHSLMDISQKLRDTADKIDAGDFGEVSHAALVMKDSEGVIVFGFGKTNSLETYYLLGCAQSQLEQ